MGVRVLAALVGVVVLVAFSYAGPALVVSEEAHRSPDALFVLGEAPDRIRTGLRLHARDRLIVTLNRPEQIVTDALGGVEADIVLGVDSTADEAGVARALVERCGWDDIVVVTSPTHTRRTRILFRSAVGAEATVRVVASDARRPGWTWWARSFTPVVTEWTKVIRDRVAVARARVPSFPYDIVC